MNTLKTKQLDEIISFALRLMPLVSCRTPNLGSVQQFCKAKYEDKIKEPGRCRRMDFIPGEDASDHLKATHLAVIVVDDMLADFFGLGCSIGAYLNPRHFQHSREEAGAIALRLAIHHIHMYQQYHESSVTGSRLELSNDAYETFEGWCAEV